MSSKETAAPELLVHDRWYALIVAGPSGSGKSVVAQEIGRELSLPVIDADDYHSRAAVDRMKSGTALTDEYRVNWAERIIGGMIAWRRRGESVIIACSCLRRRTRDRFRTYVNEARIVGGQVVIAWLDVAPEVLKTRLQHREEERTHFFPASLLASQLESAEPPDPQTEPGVVHVPVTKETPDVVARRVWESVPALHPFCARS
jgi:carbohydrate kinase (thermoresistant glucokinase family)